MRGNFNQLRTDLDFIFQEKEANGDWNICIDDNGSKLGRCINACNNDHACEDQCVEQFKIRQFDCPCEV